MRVWACVDKEVLDNYQRMVDKQGMIENNRLDGML